MSEPPLPAPVVVPGNGRSPVILSVPHSGRDIPDWLAARSTRGRRSLLSLADPYVDAIVQPLVDDGIAVVSAQTPRAAIDPNRRLDELDPMICDCPPPPPGSKAAHGIGLVPSRTRSRRPLWKERLGDAAVAMRIESAWQPYHDALSRLLADTRRRHGIAILLDCHSMPPPPTGKPRIVLGDRHGSSASEWVSKTVAASAFTMGWETARNDPYAGGAIANLHGRPDDNVHVVQVELDRAAYLDPTLTSPGPGLGRMQALMRRIADDLEAAWSASLAAE